MKKVILVTGGARSGKSTYAETVCEKLCSDSSKRAYLATSVAFDDEMKDRILKHQERRKDKYFTVEEPVYIADAIKALEGKASVLLIDCLTVWTNNLLYYLKDDSLIEMQVNNLISEIENASFDIVLVTNETGSGIVPDNALARSFRDKAGIINQKVAQVATDVIMTVCSIPFAVKGQVL